jgi:hypothetical protein
VTCPICGKPGRHERNSNRKRFRYPMDVVWVLKEESIHSILDAWHFAARVCLHQSQMVLKFPPDSELDTELAQPLYAFSMTLMSHKAGDIAKFETTHRRHIQQRVKAAGKSQPGASMSEDEQMKRLPDYDQLGFDDGEDDRTRTLMPENSGDVTHLLWKNTHIFVNQFRSASPRVASAFRSAIKSRFQYLYTKNKLKRFLHNSTSEI